MKCSHCGSEWNVRGESSLQMRNCPFCGKLLQKEPEVPAKLDSLEDCLRHIQDQFGMEPFRNGKTLLSLHSDLMPERQRDRRLIGHFVDCGGHPFLEGVLKKSKAEQSAALVRLVKRMHEDWLIREDAARRICAIWWEILGGDPDCLKSIAAPVQTTSQNSVPGKTGSTSAQAGAVCNPGDYEIVGGVLKKYKGTDPAIRLPKGVVTVDMGAFSGCKTLRSVTIPEGVETIDVQAFFRCENLEAVTFPKGLNTIGYASFRDCGRLQSVILPEGLKHIDDYAFKNCAKLQSVSLPENLETVGYEAFQDCVALQKVTLPKGLKTIVGCAFWGCSGLRTVCLPEGIQSVGDYAFARCKVLEEVKIPGTLSKISGNMFLSCESLRRVEICPGVKTIGTDAFEKCVKLQTIVIPDSLTEIHADAFKGCSGITVHASNAWKKTHPDLLARIP